MEYFKHESSYIDTGAVIGAGTKIWHFCHVMGQAQIGKECILGQNVFVGPNVWVGDRVKVQNNVSLYDGVKIEDDVFIGPSVVFTNVLNPRSFIERKEEFKPTLVKKGASIGANATLVCGTRVGQYAFVAAGSVVTKNVKDYALVAGIPAEFKYWICKCGHRIEDTNDSKTKVCPKCSEEYILDEAKVLSLSNSSKHS